MEFINLTNMYWAPTVYQTPFMIMRIKQWPKQTDFWLQELYILVGKADKLKDKIYSILSGIVSAVEKSELEK